MSIAIRFENVSKQYRLGEVGTGTLSHDLHRAWAKLRGQPDPFAIVGNVNGREQRDNSYVWALRDISFDVRQGEVLGIIGRNGAGKSTLLKLLSRVTAPTSGRIKAKGRIASLLEVGTGFHPELTGRENIYLNGAILGMTRREVLKQIDAIVAFSDCAQYIDTPVKRYSSGMMVRLGFAVAAHLRCEILIVDEVLAVGDAEFQSRCIGKMKEVSSGGGRTVLFVSHNMGSVERLCQRGVILKNGMITNQGNVNHIVDEYLGSLSIDDASCQLLTDSSRSGNGNVRLRSCKLLNNRHSPVRAVRTGDSVTLQFRVENTTSERIDGVSLGYSITSMRGESLVVSYSDYDHVSFSLEPGFNEIYTTTDVPFRNGRYHIGVRILRHLVELDWPRYPVLVLVVESGNQELSSPHSGSGLIVAKNHWRFRSNNEPA